MSKIFISCALPYANGPCHLGHIRSTYLPADIYARYNRMIGNDVLMVCATDEHGTPIAVKADKENKKPIEISKRYHDMIVKDVESMNISLDNFTRTTDEAHYEIAKNFFKTLYDNDLMGCVLFAGPKRGETTAKSAERHLTRQSSTSRTA